MKATELMINDWVMSKESQFPCRILAIRSGSYCPNSNSLISTDKNSKEWSSIDGYCPIPLTAEILEKNGIKFQFGKVWYQLHNDRIQLAWEHNGDTLWLCVDYVHELQHAMRLCRLNELADNFKV